MYITSENIMLRYNKANGNDDIASLVSKDFLTETSNTVWQVLEVSHETKGNFDLVLSDNFRFECFEYKSGLISNGEIIFNKNQIEQSNKVYGIIFKTIEYIESMVFCQFDISYAIRKGIFAESTSGKSLRYRYKLSVHKYNTLLKNHVLTSKQGNLDVKILRIYNALEIQAIIDKANDYRKNLKKLFS